MSQNSKRIDAINNTILHKIVEPITGATNTYSTDLERIGRKLLKTKFHGVYASDQLPNLTKKQPYAIVNLDKHYEAGSHWIGIAKLDKHPQLCGESCILIYDSFGRKTKDIIPTVIRFYKNAVQTDQDAEQGIHETNCGARSLAFLLICHHWGFEMAKKL